MKVYLAGPINGCTDAECNDWREAVKLALPEATCINPMRRDYRGKEDAEYRTIVDLDKRDVRSADVVLANCPKPSAGTSCEIYDAWLHSVPVVAWFAPEATVSPWIRYHSTVIVRSLPEAIAKVIEFTS